MSSVRTVTEIRNLGSCRVNRGGRDLGHTQGGVSAKITVEKREVVVDEYGNVPVDAVDAGTTIEVTVPLVQASWDNYVTSFPTGATILAANQLSFGRQVGTSLNFARLVLDPLRAADTDGIVVYRSYVDDVAELGYNNEGERILAVTFKGAIAEDRTAGDKCFRIFGGMS
jgi:hypothetical protein